MAKKFEYPPDLEYRIRIQPPSGSHRVFRLIKVYKSGRTETLKHKALDKINKDLLNGVLTDKKARRQIELLVEEIYRQVGVKKFLTVSNSDNYDLLDQFWDEQYKRRRLVDRDSAFAKYRRAVEAVGELSLRSSSDLELQEAIDKRTQGNQQRAVIGRLKSILSWLKRGDVQLILNHETDEEIKFLTKDELDKALKRIDDDLFCLMARMARGTGARIGELFAMIPSKDSRTVYIKHQVRRDGTKALAKGKRADAPGRTSIILPEYRTLIKKWIKVRHSVQIETRLNAANTIRSACEKAFPNDPLKHIKFHDLRHSYAIELCQAGVSLLQISQQLGNSQRVCEKHYTGFVATSDTIDMIERKIIASSPKET